MIVALAALVALLAPSPQAAQNAPQAGERVPPIQDVGDFYVLNFEETGGDEALSLEQFVKICQEATGINFTYTKETSQMLQVAKLRMFGPKRIPKSDFYSFFQIMMIINDFVCSRIGPDHLAVVVISSMNTQQRNNLRNDAVYVDSKDIERYASQPATLVTTVLDLPNTDVRTLSNSMRTMFTDANTQQIIPVGNSNSLIITGFGSNVASIVKMLQLVDEASKVSAVVPQFEMLPLEFASAEELADTIEELLEASRRAAQTRQQAQAAQGVTGAIPGQQSETKILVDPRTNSLLVMAMPDDMPRIKELVARLDVDVIERERTYHVYNLENVDAEELAETLDDFISDASRVTPGGPGAPGGARNQNQGGQQPAASPGASGRNEVVVVPDKATNTLLIAANRSRYEEVLDLIRRLDRRQDQVLIETALVELSGRNFLDIGVEIGLANLTDDLGSFGVTSFGLSTFEDTDGDGIADTRVPSTEFNGITAGILDGGDFNLPILLRGLKQRQDTNVLNVPSVLVNNNGSAKVVSKDEQPTTTVTLGGATGVGGAATQTNFNGYVDAGITLQISPTISASRYLRLNISLEVSTFLGTVQGAIPPPKVTRTIETIVNVPDGDTMVIGGIITDNKSKTHSGLPILGEIPILGYLFRRESDSLDKTTLYFFVTPHIMRDRDFADLAEISYRKKLEAADAIGSDRIRVLDPNFGKEDRGVDLRGFEVPLYQSPARGEVDSEAVGLDPARVNGLLRQATEPPPKPSTDDTPPVPEEEQP